MTNKNNDRINGQNDQQIRSAEEIREQIKSSGSYKLMPVTGKTRTRKQRPLLQQEKLLIASTFVKALKPLLFITYRFTCEKVFWYYLAKLYYRRWQTGS